jgi:thiamine pyrophosphokinase
MEYPGIIVGDFDSITEEAKTFFTGRLRHEPDQDSTDLSKTLKVLMEMVKI